MTDHKNQPTEWLEARTDRWLELEREPNRSTQIKVLAQSCRPPWLESPEGHVILDLDVRADDVEVSAIHNDYIIVSVQGQRWTLRDVHR